MPSSKRALRARPFSVLIWSRIARRWLARPDGSTAIFSTTLHTTFESAANPRSEEHTSELQSLRHLVCRLLLEKKKNHVRTTRQQASPTILASLEFIQSVP